MQAKAAAINDIVPPLAPIGSHCAPIVPQNWLSHGTTLGLVFGSMLRMVRKRDEYDNRKNDSLSKGKMVEVVKWLQG